MRLITLLLVLFIFVTMSDAVTMTITAMPEAGVNYQESGVSVPVSIAYGDSDVVPPFQDVETVIYEPPETSGQETISFQAQMKQETFWYGELVDGFGSANILRTARLGFAQHYTGSMTAGLWVYSLSTSVQGTPLVTARNVNDFGPD